VDSLYKSTYTLLYYEHYICEQVCVYLYEPEPLLPRLRLRLKGSGGDVDPAHRGRPSPVLPVRGRSLLDDDEGLTTVADDDEHDDGDDVRR